MHRERLHLQSAAWLLEATTARRTPSSIATWYTLCAMTTFACSLSHVGPDSAPASPSGERSRPR